MIHDVIQVGMGPVGLTMAALVGQSGHSIAVIERQHGLYGLPRAGHIDHEIVRILQSLDCHRPVMADSYPTLSYRWLNGDGELLMEFDWGAKGISGWHSDYMQYQPVIEETLAARLRADEHVELLSGWELVDFTQHDDHVEARIARTTLEPGNPRPIVTGEQRILRGRYLIGADGAASTVRRRLGIERDDLGFNERWLDVDARKKREDLEFELDCGQLCDPRRPITILPLGKRHRRWEWALLPGETIEEFERPETAWKLLAEQGLGPDDLEIVRQIVYTFEARTATEWRRGRVFLIGDAAHTMPPFMGQGMCSGMRDAKTLAWRLDLVLRGLAPDTLLDGYESERRPHALDWTVISLEAGRIPCTLDPEAARERDARFRAGWRPPMPDFPKLESGVLADAPLAGELGLQGRVAGGLFDDVYDAGAGWQVISTVADPRGALEPEQVAFLERLGTVFAHVDSGDYAAYFAKHGIEAVINRPDFYVFGGSALGELKGLVGQLEQHLAVRQFTTEEEREMRASIVLAAMLAAVLAACGGGNETAATGGSAATGQVAGTVSAAMKPLAAFPSPGAAVKAPAGKRIVAITCSSQGYGCVQGALGVQDAGKALGWKVTVVDGKGDPGAWNAAIQQAVVTKADGIVLLAVDPQLVSGALAKAKAAGIPVVSTFIPKLGGATVDGYASTDHAKGGKILADWIIGDSGGKATVLMLNEKAFPELVKRNTALTKELKTACPGCTIASTVEFNIGTMAQQLAGAVTSALQRDPKVGYVVAPFDSSGIFAGQGIRQAGKAGAVKLVGAEGDPNGIQAVQGGTQAVDLATVPPWGGWAAMDLLVRRFAGQPLEAAELPQRLFDKSNVPAGKGWSGDVDYRAKYRELWGR